MSNIPEDIYIPLNTKRDKKNNKGLLGIGIPNFVVSLIDFIKDKLKAVNGITFDSSTLTFKLGGELTENTLLETTKSFEVQTTFSGGQVGQLGQYYDSFGAYNFPTSGSKMTDILGNLVYMSVIYNPIISSLASNITYIDVNGDMYGFLITKNRATLDYKLNGVTTSSIGIEDGKLHIMTNEIWDDDTDAIANGMSAGQVYVTSGAGAAPLNIAGLVKIVQ